MKIHDHDLARLEMLPLESEIMKIWPKDEIKPAVSICVTSYNHERYIADALSGILTQITDFPFEILITDDASTDSSQSIILAYSKKYPTIIKPLLHKTNQFSLGKRINTEFNFTRAQGKYLAICEGDDYWVDVAKLQIQKEFLDINQEYVICYTDCQCFNEGGIIENNFGGSIRDLSSSELQKAASINTLTTMFRNIHFGSLNNFHGRLYGDLIIWSLLGAHGKGKFLGEIKPSMYRVHSGGIHSMKPSSEKLEMRAATMHALSIYHNKLGNKKVTEYFQAELLGYYMKQLRAKVFMIIFWKTLRMTKRFWVEKSRGLLQLRG